MTAKEILETIKPLGKESSCQVPSAPAYIRKVQTRGTLGQKRKAAKC